MFSFWNHFTGHSQRVSLKNFGFKAVCILTKHQISEEHGHDVRLLENARDRQGLPYIMKLMQLTQYPARREIFRDLMEKHNLDLNVHCETTDESIIYTLIKDFDYETLKLVLKIAKQNKVLLRLNYHNKDGISPLGVALQKYEVFPLGLLIGIVNVLHFGIWVLWNSTNLRFDRR